jgi:hypothetical protein
MEGIVCNFLQGRMGPVFFLGQNFALWQQKVKSSAKCTKSFYSGGKKKKKKKHTIYHILSQKNKNKIIIFLQ